MKELIRDSYRIYTEIPVVQHPTVWGSTEDRMIAKVWTDIGRAYGKVDGQVALTMMGEWEPGFIWPSYADLPVVIYDWHPFASPTGGLAPQPILVGAWWGEGRDVVTQVATDMSKWADVLRYMENHRMRPGEPWDLLTIVGCLDPHEEIMTRILAARFDVGAIGLTGL